MHVDATYLHLEEGIMVNTEEAMITEATEEYDDKVEEFHMEQQARIAATIAAVIIQTVRRSEDESEAIKEMANNCGHLKEAARLDFFRGDET